MSTKSTNGQDIIHDSGRLEALRRYSLNDAHAEAAFDRLTRLASKLLNAPIALVNLITDAQQLCKSAYGIPAQDANVPVGVSFCSHTVTLGKPFVVEDATKHALLEDNLFVTGTSHLRSYVGIPLQTEDQYSIGTLCVLDVEPRRWKQSDIEVVQELAVSVMMEIDLRARMASSQDELGDKDDTPLHIPARELNHFGRYNIVDHIDSGGMCDVYLCRHEHLQVPVAIKRLRHSIAGNVTLRARFALEGNIVCSLRHPNIIRVFEVGNEGDNYYMVMEYINGQTLKALIKQQAPLPLQIVIDIGKDIAEALDYAHSQQVVHRDVKPSNVMLRENPRTGTNTIYQATLMDFGIAKMIDLENHLTGENAVGTVDYMAPEQIAESNTVTGSVDIYALGTILYEMLTGHIPHKGKTMVQSIYKHLNEPVPDPRQFVPDLPQHVVDTLVQALAKFPEDRHRTAIELVAALDAQAHTGA